MAVRRLGGYALDIGKHLDRYEVDLDIFIDGMMAFSYADIKISAGDEIKVLAAVVADLNKLLDQKKKEVKQQAEVK